MREIVDKHYTTQCYALHPEGTQVSRTIQHKLVVREVHTVGRLVMPTLSFCFGVVGYIKLQIGKCFTTKVDQ